MKYTKKNLINSYLELCSKRDYYYEARDFDRYYVANQDADRLQKIIMERFPDYFKTPEGEYEF